MTLDDFWAMIRRSRSVIRETDIDGNMDRQRDALAAELETLSPEKVLSFYRHFLALFHDAYRWDFWSAAQVIEGGCSDDGFMDFRSWLVSMGREAYEAALKDPDQLGDIASHPSVEACSFEDFPPVSPELVEGADLPLHPVEPAGTRMTEDLEELRRLLPRTWARFGERR